MYYLIHLLKKNKCINLRGTQITYQNETHISSIKEFKRNRKKLEICF